MEKIKIKKILVILIALSFICSALALCVAGTDADLGNIKGFIYGWWSDDALQDPSFKIYNYTESNGTFTIGSGSPNQYNQFRLFNAVGNYHRSLFFLPFNATSGEVYTIKFTVYSGGSNAPVSSWSDFFSGGFSGGNSTFSNNSEYPTDQTIKSLISSSNTDEGYTNLPSDFDKVFSSNDGYNTFVLNPLSTSSCEVTLQQINFGDNYNVKFISWSTPIGYNPENVYIIVNSISVSFVTSDTAVINNRLSDIEQSINSSTVKISQDISDQTSSINNNINDAADQISNKVESVGETVGSKIDDLNDTITARQEEEDHAIADNNQAVQDMLEDTEVDKLPNQDNLFNILKNLVNAFITSNVSYELQFPSVTIPYLNLTTPSGTADFSRWIGSTSPIYDLFRVVRPLISLFVLIGIIINIYSIASKVAQGRADALMEEAEAQWHSMVDSMSEAEVESTYSYVRHRESLDAKRNYLRNRR